MPGDSSGPCRNRPCLRRRRHGRPKAQLVRESSRRDDPARLTAGERSLRTARARYRRSADPERIAENFAAFDEVVEGLRAGTMTWQEASERGFTRSPENEDRFYFVGYEMARAIEQYCGRECIGRLFQRPPVEFFRQYVSLYREHPQIRWRFAPATEEYLVSLP